MPEDAGNGGEATGVGSKPVEIPAPPPTPKSIFDVIYEATDVNIPKQRISEDIRGFIKDSSLDGIYDFVFLYDDHSQITRFTSNRIYSAITGGGHNPEKGLFLLLHTNGGRVEPAYLISKCCKKSAPKFVAVVPRLAKSAGTLIALGADEIHMGIISELGPIDPQIGDYPALGLGSAVENIATLCKKHPDAVEMLAKYLATNLNLHNLGYSERVSESAVQYAERLLSEKHLPDNQTPADVAKRFVYGYKDHGFVIDRDEATQILGDDIVKSDTPEYKLANRIHEYLETVNLAYGFFKNHHCRLLGNLADAPIVSKND
ncbi:MAG: hypothetical protein WB952_03905 [Terriglobales bacterium]